MHFGWTQLEVQFGWGCRWWGLLVQIKGWIEKEKRINLIMPSKETNDLPSHYLCGALTI